MDFGVFGWITVLATTGVERQLSICDAGRASVTQADIAGFAPGDVSAKPLLGSHNFEPRFFSLQLTATLLRRLNTVSLGDRAISGLTEDPAAASSPGTTGAAGRRGDFLAKDWMSAREPRGARLGPIMSTSFATTSPGLKENTISNSRAAGGTYRCFLSATTKIVGQLTSLIYFLNAARQWRSPDEPSSTCSAAVTADCLRSADVAPGTIFCRGLGLVDQAGVIATRDSNLIRCRLNTPLRSYVHWENSSRTSTTSGRIRPSLTITLG